MKKKLPFPPRNIFFVADIICCFIKIANYTFSFFAKIINYTL